MTTRTPILVGVLLFAALAVSVVPRHVDSIERDLSQKIELSLSQQGLAARVSVSGRDVYLRGRVQGDVAQQRAGELVREIRGVRRVFNELGVGSRHNPGPLASIAPLGEEVGQARPIPPKPAVDQGPAAPRASSVHRVTAELSADRTLTFTGHAPSERAKDTWLAKALELFPDGQLRDRLMVEPTEEGERMVVAVTAGLASLRDLQEGRLSATMSRLRVSGKASTEETEEKIRESLAAVLPSGMKLAVDVYSPAPVAEVRTTVVRSMLSRGRDDSVILSGVVASEDMKQAWLGKAGEIYSPARVRDRLRVASIKPPAGYGTCLMSAIPWVGKLKNGRVEVSPKVVRVSGKTANREDYDNLRSDLEAVGCTLDLARLAAPAARRGDG